VDVDKKWYPENGMLRLSVISTIKVVDAPGCKSEASGSNGPWHFGVETGSGKVKISMRIDWPPHQAPGRPLATADNVQIPPFDIPYECTSDGDAVEPRPGNAFKLTGPTGLVDEKPVAGPLSVAFEVYHRTTHPSDDYRPTLVPEEVMQKWMKQLEILHIVVIPTVTWHEVHNGSRTVVRKAYVDPIPPEEVGATGPRTARLPRLEIILDPIGMPPPMETPNGTRFTVYFNHDSSSIDEVVEMPFDGKTHSFWNQAHVLEEYIKNLYSRWDFAAALVDGRTRLRLEGYSDATYNRMTKAQYSGNAKLTSEAFRYNWELSKKRNRVVADRLMQITSTPSMLKKAPALVEGKNLITNFNGMAQAKGGDILEDRRVDILMENPDEFVEHIKETFKRKPGGKK
jgi:hypothetical protein